MQIVMKTQPPDASVAGSDTNARQANALLICLGGLLTLFLAWMSFTLSGRLDGDLFALPAVMWTVWSVHDEKRSSVILLPTLVTAAIAIPGGLLLCSVQDRVGPWAYAMSFVIGGAIAGAAVLLRACRR
ncbi:MAG: hypothetical protein KF774_12800 [Planctomyces sp.]|nr:hypothetical protein [Planctomyces sp.]